MPRPYLLAYAAMIGFAVVLVDLQGAVRAEPDVPLGASPPPRDDPGTEPGPATPIRVTGGIAPIDDSNTVRDRTTGMQRSLFDFPATPERTVMGGDSPAARRLNAWYREGTAAGNHGDPYDNRDRGHSSLAKGIFPQVARTTYSEKLQKAGLHRGFNARFLFNAPTVGNAPVAITNGPLWRSIARYALTDRWQMMALFQQYTSNAIYVYPEHRDHDPGLGDLFPASTPYMLMSQGSSGSDQPLVQAVIAILAAFRPEVKAFLVEQGLIAPTVQWIFRRSLAGVTKDDIYLSGKAHPSVFDARDIALLEMVERAHQLHIEDVPPMVRLKVVWESGLGKIEQDTLPEGGEVLFDTPSAIARVFRSTAYEKRLIVDAGATKDPNGRPLSFRWSVLRGDGERIAIRPLDDGSKAEIVIPWHERGTIPWQRGMTSDRMDIGVFADNGAHLSAPAFISVVFPPDQKRLYRSDKKIVEIDYDDAAYRDRYADPVLFAKRAWHDLYGYDEYGEIVGWDRFLGDRHERFAPDGAMVVEADALGRPVRVVKARYRLRQSAEKPAEVVVDVTGAGQQIEQPAGQTPH